MSTSTVPAPAPGVVGRANERDIAPQDEAARAWQGPQDGTGDGPGWWNRAMRRADQEDRPGGGTVPGAPGDAAAEPVADPAARRSRGRPARGDDGLAARAAILDAARATFARHGYTGATLRAIATAAGVDHTLITYYFGSKARLFAITGALPSDARHGVRAALRPCPDGAGERVVRAVLESWGEETAGTHIRALLRSLIGTENEADVLRAYVEEQLVAPVVEAIPGPDARERAALVASLLVGVGLGRYVTRVQPLEDLDPERLVARLGPLVQSLLDDPAPPAD